MPAPTPEDVRPPHIARVRQRVIPERTVEWIYECDRILREHGQVVGLVPRKTRFSARSKARNLIRYLVELRVRERDELSEHVEPVKDGWQWSVILLSQGGGRRDG